MIGTDLDLLARYSRESAEDDFAAVVRQHLNLVYSTALRQVRSPELAEEVTQSAFLSLAQQAGKLAPNTIVSAWLYTVTRRAAANVIRREARRVRRETEALEINAMNSEHSDWAEIRPLLDEAMHSLDATDRTAVLLRYFENKSLREVGAALGTSENAIQKRLVRAVQRLRGYLAKRGVVVGAGSLVAAVSAQAVQAAPIPLAGTICSAAVVAAAAVPAFTLSTLTTTIAMTTLQKGMIAAVLIAGVGAGIYERGQVSRRRAHAESLEPGLVQQTQETERARAESDARLASELEERARRKKAAADSRPLDARASDSRRREQEPAERKSATATAAAPAPLPAPLEISVASWTDAGFGTPSAALKTRGWAVLNGSRARFKESIHVTDGARKMLEDLLIKMAETSQDPNKEILIKQLLDGGYGVEEGILLPMMAENEKNGYTGYRILAEESLSADERLLQVETQMTSAPAKREELKFRRFDDAWKIVIDEEFIKAAR